MMPRVFDLFAVALVAAFVFFVLAPVSENEAQPSYESDNRRQERIRDQIIAEGTEETGASNLVTAIYLGYRAFDTLGETIVLLLAVLGITYLVEAKR